MAGTMPKKLKKKNPKMKRPEEAKGIDFNLLPTGKVLSAPIKGEFISLPLMGYVAKRYQTGTPIVMVVAALLSSVEDPVPKGTVQVELPIFPSTEKSTVAALERYGWDGRIWPMDPGWPTDTPNEAEIRSMLLTAGLQATLTFSGASAQMINVAKAAGPFLMPPLPEAEDVDPKKLERLRQLCEDHKQFYRASGPGKLTLS